MNPTTKPFTLTIIGGGLAGLLLAIALSRRHIPFHIYESQPRFTETSAGIGFSPNSVRAMALIAPEIHAAYRALATENGWNGKKDTWFDIRMGMEVKEEHGVVEYKEEEEEEEEEEEVKHVIEIKMPDEAGNVLRARFMEELVRLLPDRGEGCVSFSKTLVGLEQSQDEGKGVKLHFKDGTTAHADAVVGCDGIRTVTRRLLLGEEHPASRPVFTGVYVYRGLVAMEDAIAAVGEEKAVNSQIYLGKGGNVVTYPIESGAVLNVVAFHKHEGEWEGEKWIKESSRGEMLADFEGWVGCVGRLLKDIEKPMMWALFDMPPAPKYAFGLCALLGDAAHASTSHGGAGAGMAVEDTFILAELLADPLVRSIEDVPNAFEVYDRVRRSRTQRLVKYSRESGMLFQLRHPEFGEDIEKVRDELKSRQNWIWDIDLIGQGNEAKGLLRDMQL